jgi:hypothetical protein
MLTCDVIGNGPANPGLGNQMCVIAATLSLAIDNDVEAVFPDLAFPPYVFYGNTIFSNLKTWGSKSFVECVHQETPFTSTIYNEIPFRDNMCLRGHYQSYKYFYHNLKKIRDAFRIPAELTEVARNKYADVLSLDNTVAVHVRRGDYMNLQSNYATLTADYYRRALDEIGEDSKVVLFSDDIEWCESTLAPLLEENVVLVRGEMDIIDLFLMSRMKHNVIANSTFSWWGALLNENPNKKVVCPLEWFGPARTQDNARETADLMPPTWTRI